MLQKIQIWPKYDKSRHKRFTCFSFFLHTSRKNTSKYHAGTLICKSPCNASCNTSATSQQHNPIFHSSQMLLNNIFGQISYFHPFGRYFLVPSSISLTSCLMSCSLHFLPLTWGSFIKARTTSSSLQVRAASSMVS